MLRIFLLFSILTGVTGVGVVLLNPELLLAFCFLIFCFFCVKHSNPLQSSLQHFSNHIKECLIDCMLLNLKQQLNAKKVFLRKKMELFESFELSTKKKNGLF
jgi:hypothetical protein